MGVRLTVAERSGPAGTGPGRILVEVRRVACVEVAWFEGTVGRAAESTVGAAEGFEETEKEDAVETPQDQPLSLPSYTAS